jgi:sigma-B regulation protein RsbU (phosphoserine phosphatase)
MGFRQRLILFVSTLITATVAITALLLTWHAYNGLIDEAEADGELVALLLARSLSAAGHVPMETEKSPGEDRLINSDQRSGVDFMVHSLVAGSDINAVWLLDNNMNTLAYGSLKGAQTNPSPSRYEQELLEQVYRNKEISSFIDADQLTVIAPVPADTGHSAAIALVRLPLDNLNALLARSSLIAAGLAFGVVLIGVLLSVFVAGRVTRPILAISNAAERVQAGQYDPLMLETEAKRGDELGRLAGVFRHMAAQVFAREEKLDALVKLRTQALQDKNTQLEAAQRTIQNELKVARSLQLHILPTVFPVHPDYEVFASMIPAREMSGDFYDLFSIDEHRRGIVIADVSGKGVPAAFFMAVARTELQDVAMSGDRPGDVLARTNDALCEQNPLSLFVTVFYGILDIRHGQFIYANGGHNPPLLVDDRDARPLPLTGGMALGVMPDLEYRNHSLELSAVQTLFLYTDGITEAFNEMNEAFGDERLQEHLVSRQLLDAKKLTSSTISAVEAFIGDAEQSDDITCMTMRWLHGADTTREQTL